MKADIENPILKQIANNATVVENEDLWSSCLLRGCFDVSSAEWSHSSMEEKEEALRIIVNEQGVDTLKLAMGLLDYCNHETNKEMKVADLVISMGKLLGHVLKNN